MLTRTNASSEGRANSCSPGGFSLFPRTLFRPFSRASSELVHYGSLRRDHFATSLAGAVGDRWSAGSHCQTYSRWSLTILARWKRAARTLLVGFSVLLLCHLRVSSRPRWQTSCAFLMAQLLFRIAIIDLPFAAIYASYDGILYGRRRFRCSRYKCRSSTRLIKLLGMVALLDLGFSVEWVLI